MKKSGFREIKTTSAAMVMMVVIFALASNSYAQWKKLFQFPEAVQTIFFLDSSINSDIGFIGVSKFNGNNGGVWKSIDGGLSWEKKTVVSGYLDKVIDFIFKDAFTGWFAVEGSSCYKTFDGGETWVAIATQIGEGGGIFYNRKNNLLLLSDQASGKLAMSRDEGLSWTYSPQLIASFGYSFFSDLQGIVGSGTTGTSYTDDGGLTWTPASPNVYENWQPLTVKNSSKCFLLCEPESALYSSSDYGRSYTKVFNFPPVKFLRDPSGCIRGDLTHLFVQSSRDAAEYSTDEGNSWMSFCGPKNVSDTRFFVKGDSVFMGDTSGGLWLNTTGIGSNSTPQLSTSSVSLLSSSCLAIDTVINITFFDSCNNMQAKLLAADLSGSSNYLLSAPFNAPRIIHPNDSIVIHYNPSGLQFDTASLHLRFHLGWKDFDTNLQIIGKPNINPQSRFSMNEIHLESPQCFTTADTIILFSFTDSCSGTQARLVSVFISGSNNYSFTSPSAIPRTIHPDDSLIISYNPQTSQPDTAQLHLRFHLGWKDFDTTISLFGVGRIPRQNIRFISSLSTNAAPPKADVNLFIKPDKLIKAKGLQSISFDINYIGDLLDVTGYLNNITTSIPGASITVGARSHSGRIETLPIKISGTDISLDPAHSIVDVKFKTMVTDTASTSISMTNLKLNGGDPDFANCILSADSANTFFTLLAQCGDSTLSKFLDGTVPIIITSIHPNPAQDEVEIELHSAIKQDVNLEVFDALGARVFSMMQNISGGANTIHFDTKGLSAGVYLVRVGNITQSFVKAK